MATSRSRAAAFASALAALVIATTASGATSPPRPFGHTCSPVAEALFCPTTTLAQRISSFDGVPLDVDVTLPAAGDGPFPTLVLLHGYSKVETEAADPSGDGKPALVRNNNLYFAAQGYAVVTPSARGFGRSCGTVESRAEGVCDRGWLHLADQRYEVRDVQEILGSLVDQGIADPARIGVTGFSYGGGQALQLAYLKDRIRLPGGEYAAWQSPAGVPVSIAAAAPVAAWSDLASAFTPNGRYLDDRPYEAATEAQPLGVALQSHSAWLYAPDRQSSLVAPVGVDPTADVVAWLDRARAGEPEDESARDIATELRQFHSALSIPGVPAPLLMANGWADDLFGAAQALRVYNSAPGADVSLLFGDFGHPRTAGNPATLAMGADRRDAFFAAHLLGRVAGTAQPPGSVEAMLTMCAGSRPGLAPLRAANWKTLSPGTFILTGGEATQTIRSRGGDPALAKAFDPVSTTGPCKTVADDTPPGDAYFARRSRGVTLLGLTTIRATVKAKGRFGQIAARLWDVDRKARTMRLVDRGVLRLRDNEHRRLRFQLNGQGYRFLPGRTIRLQLSGSDAGYLRPSNGLGFTVALSNVTVSLPVRQRPSRALGVGAP